MSPISSNQSLATRELKLSLPEKAQEIFEGRTFIRKQIQTNDRIKNIAVGIFITIGLATMITGCVLGFPATIGAGSAIGIYLAGSALAAGTAGFALRSKKRVLKDEEESQFWKDISTDSLKELGKKHSYYYKRLSEITYEELIESGNLDRESANELQSILDKYYLLNREKSQKMESVENIRDLEDLSKTFEEIERDINNRYALKEEVLAKEFEDFRTNFIYNKRTRCIEMQPIK